MRLPTKGKDMISAELKQARFGYEQNVGRFRAKGTKADPEQDSVPMVQELVARLRFASEHVLMAQKNIIDYGCGTGLGLQWTLLHTQARKMLGVDASAGAIAFARAHYPGIQFQVVNIENPPETLSKDYDIALCFEVLEHLIDPSRALSYLINHYLKHDGTLIASTPNRMVFSSGMDPSPINRTHIREMDLSEFCSLLDRYFAKIEIWGMRFKDPARMHAHTRMVKQACEGYRLLGEWWWNPFVNRIYRWIVRGEIWHLLRGRQWHQWRAMDFEFIDSQLDSAIWFFAIASRVRSLALANA
jgi:SAM-dependent methyltransferase